MPKSQLHSLLSPQSIAVVGVSKSITKLGTVIFNNLVYGGYKGKIFPVNPKYQELFNHKCYAKVSDIPTTIDLVIIVVPTLFVFSVIKDSAQARVESAIIITAGFKETGATGNTLEQKIVAYAQKYELRILGPNCLGIISPQENLNASFAPTMPDVGNIAFLSQSGAFNTALLDLAREQNLGFHHFISLGNKSDINELELIEYWLQDPAVKVIGAYIEEFSQGRRLLEIIKKYPRKPIVLLHPGDTSAGQQAMVSHTGSLAGTKETIRTALRQHGIVQVQSIQNMFWTMMLFSWLNLPAGNRTLIITNAGGPGIMMTDMVVQAGLKMVQPSTKFKQSLKEVLPSSASLHNPIDILGDAHVNRYEQVLALAIQEPDIDMIIVLLTPQLTTQIEETAKLLVNVSRLSSKPIIPVFIGGLYARSGISLLHENKVPAFKYGEDATIALRYLNRYLNNVHQSIPIKFSTIKKPQFKRLVDQYTTSKTQALPQSVTQKLLQEMKITTPQEKLVTTVKDALDFAKKCKFPVVIKAVTEDIAHKTDLKALYLNIQNKQDLTSYFKQLQKDITKITQNSQPNILIQEQIKSSIELLIGANRDGDSKVYSKKEEQQKEGFGHLLVFGQGGIYTEVYKDIATRLVPASRHELLEMISESKISHIITGVRGEKPLAIDQLLLMLQKIQELVQLYPQIEQLDINPLFLTKKRCIAIDVKIFVRL